MQPKNRNIRPQKAVLLHSPSGISLPSPTGGASNGGMHQETKRRTSLKDCPFRVSETWDRLGCNDPRYKAMTEHEHGVMLMSVIVRHGNPLLKRIYHIPNGGQRHIRVAQKLKAEGVRAGVLDYCLPVPVGGYHGLYLELKRVNEKPTSEQYQEIRMLEESGYFVKWAQGYLEAIRAISDYIAMKP